jgi:hypothetical protein
MVTWARAWKDRAWSGVVKLRTEYGVVVSCSAGRSVPVQKGRAVGMAHLL